MKKKTQKSTDVQKLTLISLFSAAAIVFGYIEFMIPFDFGIPGIKLGLANLITVLLLYTFDTRMALSVSLIRIFITALLFGSLYSLAYSLVGGILSFTIMSLTKKVKDFSAVGVSIAGGILHNIGQLIVAIITFGVAEIGFYLPILLAAGAITGTIIGICSLPIINKIKKIRASQ